MKINGIGGPNFVQGNYKINKASASEKYNAAQGGDKVSISDEAMSFSKVFAAAKQDANVRETDVKSRIETIREQIESGTYDVSSEDIADSILRELCF
ncbi:MAG: flagellar biosynthesis anti-sigma factor FlgM [Clostridiales bacterium]|nr:flagellar biosynthesis anti-sigma factor FlgM [Clostridiales bacterium]